MRSTIRSAVALSGVLFLVAASGRADPKPMKEAKAPAPPKGLSSRNDRIGGKTFDEWMTDLEKSRDPAVVENAIRTIILYDPSLSRLAAPILVKKLKNPDLDLSIKVNAAIFLGRVELDADDRRDAVRSLKRLLGHSQADVKLHAALALATIGREAKEAVPSLLNALGDESWEIRRVAALALGAIAYVKGKSPEEHVVERLRRRVARDRCFVVRLEALRALIMLGSPASESARASLLQTMKAAAQRDEAKTVRIWAQVAVMLLTGKAEPKRLTFIAGLLQDHVVGVRCAAAHALGALGTRASPQLRPLVAKLADKDPYVVEAVIQALSRIGKDAVPEVADHLTDPERHTRVAAARALAAIGAVDRDDVRSQVRPLIKALSDREPAMVQAAVVALGVIVRKPADVEEVGRQLASTSPKVRGATARVLALIGPEASSQVNRLRAALDDPDPTIVLEVMQALVSIGRPAESAIPDLQRLARNRPESRDAVNRAIEVIRNGPGK